MTTNSHITTSKGNNDECYTYRYTVEPLLELRIATILFLTHLLRIKKKYLKD